jgi:hypothetical protein
VGGARPVKIGDPSIFLQDASLEQSCMVSAYHEFRACDAERTQDRVSVFAGDARTFLAMLAALRGVVTSAAWCEK